MSTFTKPYTLPQDFLSPPGPAITIQKIDFKDTNLPEYDGLYATVIDNAFTAEECRALVRAAEAHTHGVWEQAMVNVGMGQQMLMTDTRDCGRIIWDDRALVEKLWSRVRDHVPEIHRLKDVPAITGNGPVKRKETWEMTRLNERMRFLKYTKGQYFRPHMDGAYPTPDGQELSFFTLHLYLNSSSPSPSLPTTPTSPPLLGGATTFHSLLIPSSSPRSQLDIEPKTGRVLLFQHRGLLHSGADVLAGVKFTLRTDLMFRRVGEKEG